MIISLKFCVLVVHSKLPAVRADTFDHCRHVGCLYVYFLRPSLEKSEPSVRSTNATSNPTLNSTLRPLDPGRAVPHTT